MAIGKFMTNILIHVDDIFLLSVLNEGSQECLDDLCIYCSEWKLKINTKIRF